MKYKVGDSFLLRMTIDSVDEDCGDYCMGKEADGAWLSEEAIDKLSAKAAAYAAKSAPAPVSTAWEPKVGERVLVEAEVGSEPDAQGDYSVLFDYHTRSNIPALWDAVVSRSAIVGPAPVRARFRRDDRAFSRTENDFVDVQYDADGGWYVINANGDMVYADDGDLLTVCELRERLGKK